MKNQDLFKLANEFNKQVKKLAQDSQPGAVDSVAFSKNGIIQKGEWAEKLGNLKQSGHQLVGDGIITNILAAFYNKTGQVFNLNLNVVVDSTNPKIPANWDIQISPASLKTPVANALNKYYLEFFGTTLQANATANSQNPHIGPAKGVSHINNWSFD